MFVRGKKSGRYEYLQVVRSVRVDGEVRQEVIATLGRLDVLRRTGALDALLSSCARFADRVAVLDAVRAGRLAPAEALRTGPGLVFERLWREAGMPEILRGLLAGRRYEFPVERAVFLTVLHRLFDPGSDRAAEVWREGYALEGMEALDLHHLCRAMAWLGEPLPVVDRLRGRFGVRAVCIVADRGMVSQEVIRGLGAADRNVRFILGMRLRNCVEVRDEVLSRGGRYQDVRGPRQHAKDPSPLKVKEVWVGDHRYIVCLNEEEARKDARDREAIVASLRQRLARGEKTLVAHRGYKRLLERQGAGHFAIDEAALAAEARYDGKWVLRTDTHLGAAAVALKYKELWRVERLFRTIKSILATRPIYHKCDETIRGHVFCSFLALVLLKDMEAKLEARGWAGVEWERLKRDLDDLQQFTLRTHGKSFQMRTAPKGDAGKALQAVGVALGPVLRPCGGEPG